MKQTHNAVAIGRIWKCDCGEMQSEQKAFDAAQAARAHNLANSSVEITKDLKS